MWGQGETKGPVRCSLLVGMLVWPRPTPDQLSLSYLFKLLSSSFLGEGLSTECVHMGLWVPASGVRPQVGGSVCLGDGEWRDLSEWNPVPATGLGPGLRGLAARDCGMWGCVSTSEDQARLAGEWVKWLRSWGGVGGCVSLEPRSHQELTIGGA